MKARYQYALATALSVTASLSTHAALIDFDTYTQNEFLHLSTTLDGFSWVGTGVMSSDYAKQKFAGSGFENGLVSPEYVAYNWGNGTIEFDRGGQIFNFENGYISAAHQGDVNITVTGYKDGRDVFSKTVKGYEAQHTFYGFNFTGIDKVIFSTPSKHFVLDSLTYTIPEPASLAFLTLGAIALLKRS